MDAAPDEERVDCRARCPLDVVLHRISDVQHLPVPVLVLDIVAGVGDGRVGAGDGCCWAWLCCCWLMVVLHSSEPTLLRPFNKPLPLLPSDSSATSCPTPFSTRTPDL